MLTNNELKVLSEVIEYLSLCRGPKTIYFCNELDKIYHKLITNKKEQSKRVCKFNKNNKKYHNLISALSYNRKRGNQSRVREIEKQLEEYKKYYFKK